MTATSGKMYVPLYFAVIDDNNPSEWKPFDYSFRENVDRCRKIQVPFGHPLANSINLEFNALLVGIKELLEGNNAHQIVGIIFDACKKEPVERQKRLDDLRELLVQQNMSIIKRGGEPPYKQVGVYNLWIVSDKSEFYSLERDLVPEIRSMIEFHLKKYEPNIWHDFINRDDMLDVNVRTCLSNVIYNLRKGGGV